MNKHHYLRGFLTKLAQQTNLVPVTGFSPDQQAQIARIHQLGDQAQQVRRTLQDPNGTHEAFLQAKEQFLKPPAAPQGPAVATSTPAAKPGA